MYHDSKTFMVHYRGTPSITHQYSSKVMVANSGVEALSDFMVWAKGTGNEKADNITVWEKVEETT